MDTSKPGGHRAIMLSSGLKSGRIAALYAASAVLWIVASDVF
jgi:hypothetical protein